MMVKWRWKGRQKLPGVSLEVCSMWLPKRSVWTMFIWVRVSFWGSLFPVRIGKIWKRKLQKGKENCDSVPRAVLILNQETTPVMFYSKGPNTMQQLAECWTRKGRSGWVGPTAGQQGWNTWPSRIPVSFHLCFSRHGVLPFSSETTHITRTWNCWNRSGGGQDVQRTGTPLLWRRRAERAGVAQPGEEKVPGRPCSSLTVLKEGLQEMWRTFDNRHAVTRPGEIALNGKKILLDKMLGRNPLQWGWWDSGMGCPEKLGCSIPGSVKARLDGSLSNLD